MVKRGYVDAIFKVMWLNIQLRSFKMLIHAFLHDVRKEKCLFCFETVFSIRCVPKAQSFIIYFYWNA